MQRAYNVRQLPTASRPQKARKPLLILVFCLIATVVYVVYCAVRPLPAPKVVIEPPVVPAQVRVKVPWPTSGEAAIGAIGYGLLDTSGDQKPLPTASVAKVITALVVLNKKPLKAGEQGPTITFSQADNDLYNKYVSEEGSVVPVSAGDSMTEYQALEAMMLPSANNVADSLAIWAYGSLPAYQTAAQNYVKTLGMTTTTIGNDASGFDPSTTSTATDFVKLGTAAAASPALATIMNQSSVDIPGFGTYRNVNSLVGQYGIRGIKTGNTDQAGGCFLGAADVKVGNKTVTFVTAVMGSPDLGSALRNTIPLVEAAPSEFQTVTLISAGKQIGSVNTAWGSTAAVKSTRTVTVTTWSGTAISPEVHPAKVSVGATSGSQAGTFIIKQDGQSQTVNLALAGTIEKPSFVWRLTHPV